jgi:hypothetical protein
MLFNGSPTEKYQATEEKDLDTLGGLFVNLLNTLISQNALWVDNRQDMYIRFGQ